MYSEQSLHLLCIYNYFEIQNIRFLRNHFVDNINPELIMAQHGVRKRNHGVSAHQIGNIIDNFHPNIRFPARESKMAQKNGLTYN